MTFTTDVRTVTLAELISAVGSVRRLVRETPGGSAPVVDGVGDRGGRKRSGAGAGWQDQGTPPTDGGPGRAMTMTDNLVSDPASGLFSEAMLRALLPSRVATARRTLRQLGLILVSVTDGPGPDQVADEVRRAIRDSDMAARLDDGTIAIVLEFTPSEGCLVVVERLQRRITEDHPGSHVRSGVACYPAHAISAEELVDVAQQALARAHDGSAAIAPVPD
jgi:hypothetical protein